MPGNNNPKEYIDIPINPSEAPLSLFDKFQPPILPTNQLEIGLDFINNIDKAVRSQDCQN